MSTPTIPNTQDNTEYPRIIFVVVENTIVPQQSYSKCSLHLIQRIKEDNIVKSPPKVSAKLLNSIMDDWDSDIFGFFMAEHQIISPGLASQIANIYMNNQEVGGVYTDYFIKQNDMCVPQYLHSNPHFNHPYDLACPLFIAKSKAIQFDEKAVRFNIRDNLQHLAKSTIFYHLAQPTVIVNEV